MKKLTTLMILSLALVPNFAKAEVNPSVIGTIAGATAIAAACGSGAMSSVALRASNINAYSPSAGCLGGAAIVFGAMGVIVGHVALAQEAPSQQTLQEINAGADSQDVSAEAQGE